jgi:hypothetical protein
MNTIKILWGGLAGGMALFLLGWAVYGILLMNYMTENTNQCMARAQEEMVWWAGLLAQFAWGFMIALIISWSKTPGAVSGAKKGIAVGLLSAISIDLFFYSMTTMYSNAAVMFLDIVVFTVMMTVVGAFTGWVMSLGKQNG